MALIIGNGAYAHVKALPNPPSDARAVAKSLRNIGFTVSEGVDLDRAAMQKMTRDFLREAARAQVVVVYYAGQGVPVDGRNYLIPIDVELKPGARMTDTMIDIDTIMAGLDDQVRTNILIFDASRNNPMAQQVASVGTSRAIEAASHLAALTSLGAGATLGAGTLIAFATAPGQVALDGEGANSPFSAALSRHIGTPGLEVQQMLTRVRAEVVSTTKSKQVPWSNSSLLGEVYLAEKPGACLLRRGEASYLTFSVVPAKAGTRNHRTWFGEDSELPPSGHNISPGTGPGLRRDDNEGVALVNRHSRGGLR